MMLTRSGAVVEPIIRQSLMPSISFKIQPSDFHVDSLEADLHRAHSPSAIDRILAGEQVFIYPFGQSIEPADELAYLFELWEEERWAALGMPTTAREGIAAFFSRFHVPVEIIVGDPYKLWSEHSWTYGARYHLWRTGELLRSS